VKPRVLLVGRTRYSLPLAPTLQRKFDALDDVLEVRVLAAAPSRTTPPEGRFVLARPPRVRAVDGIAFWSTLPLRIARELRRFRPDAILAQSAYDAAAAELARALARSDARVIVDVHGDWRTATRLYGAPARRLLAPLADRLALAGLRRADAVRAVSDYTARLVREVGLEADDVFPAFMELEPFLATPPAPLPERPQALFIGVLERYKNIDGLAAAWRAAAPRVPEAQLRIVGAGSRHAIVETLVAELPGRTSWTPRLDSADVARALDASSVLVLPSRSEGMGRVVVEAFCRGRGAVATRVGGIPELVQDGVNGLLVERGDPAGLADALVDVLGRRELADRLGKAARAGVSQLLATPEQYAERLRALVVETAPRLGSG
jgi:glycosyltransferase involved in cell wall biosynthesis